MRSTRVRVRAGVSQFEAVTRGTDSMLWYLKKGDVCRASVVLRTSNDRLLFAEQPILYAKLLQYFSCCQWRSVYPMRAGRICLGRVIPPRLQTYNRGKGFLRVARCVVGLRGGSPPHPHPPMPHTPCTRNIFLVTPIPSMQAGFIISGKCTHHT